MATFGIVMMVNCDRVDCTDSVLFDTEQARWSN